MNSLEEKTIVALRWIIEIFNRNNIDYQIAGGFSAKIYGSPRILNDIDFDVPEKYFPILLSEISPYITSGPIRLLDGKWDCDSLVLNYHGQEIDISGVDTMKMSNLERTKWISYKENYFNNLDMNVMEIAIKVIHPRELLAYKKELDGEHQLIDIQAIEHYLIEHTPQTSSD